MIRRVAAVVLALTLNPAALRAQDTVLTVTVPSADVHKGPSNVTPVLGHVSRGTVLPVSRNLGSWAKIAWPDAPDGVGYVHVTMGRDRSVQRVPRPPRTCRREHPPHLRRSATRIPHDTIPPGRRPGEQRIAVAVNCRHACHVTSSASAGWSGQRAALARRRARGARPSRHSARVHARCDDERRRRRPRDVDTVRAGVVFALFDHVSDYVWIRPYVGSVMSFRRQTLKVSAPAAWSPCRTTALDLGSSAAAS